MTTAPAQAAATLYLGGPVQTAAPAGAAVVDPRYSFAGIAPSFTSTSCAALKASSPEGMPQ